MDEGVKDDLVGLTAEIVSAYVSNNTVGAAELPLIIGDVHQALSRACNNLAPVEREELRPAIAVKKSVTPDYIICLEDGKKFKSLKRHIRTHYNLSPEEYREKWGLPHDYPMVAPNYAAARSQLAAAKRERAQHGSPPSHYLRQRATHGAEVLPRHPRGVAVDGRPAPFSCGAFTAAFVFPSLALKFDSSLR